MKFALFFFVAFALKSSGAVRRIFKIEDVNDNDVGLGVGQEGAALTLTEDRGFWDRFLAEGGSYSFSTSLSLGQPSSPRLPDTPSAPSTPTSRTAPAVSSMPAKTPSAPVMGRPIDVGPPSGVTPSKSPAGSPGLPTSPSLPSPPSAPSDPPPSVPVLARPVDPGPPSATPAGSPTLPTDSSPPGPPSAPSDPSAPSTLTMPATTPSTPFLSGPVDPTAPVPTAPVIPSISPAVAPSMGMSLGDIVRTEEDLSSLETLLEGVGLLDLLDMPGLDYTAFAPTNDAFSRMDPELLANLANIEEWGGHTTCVLTYHLVDTIVRTEDFVEGDKLKSIEGKEIIVTSEDPPGVNDVDITVTNIQASNGVAHVVPEVLLATCVTESIRGFLESRGDFTILLSLLDSSGISASLDGLDPPITLFAPPDNAFDKLNLTEIGSDADLVVAVLRQHAFSGNVYSSLVETAEIKMIDSLRPTTTFISEGGKGLAINDVLGVELDILRSNGVVHTVEDVVLPLFVDQFLLQASALSKGTISFGTFARALAVNELLDFLGYFQPLATDTVFLTLFAPDDRAFENMDQVLFARVFDTEWIYHNQAAIIRHISVVGVFTSTDLVESGSIDVRSEERLTVSRELIVSDGDGISVTIDPDIADLLAVNGAVHSVDGLLLPAIQFLSIFEVSKANPSSLSTFISLVEQAGLSGALDKDGPITVFAPTNEAFAAIGISPDTVIPVEDLASITDTLLYHVLEGNYVFPDLESGQELETLQGDSILFITESTPEPRYFVNGERILSMDLPGNGVMYTIEGVLLPPVNDNQQI